MDDNLWIEIMLSLDLRSLNRFILSNKRAYQLYHDPRFYKKYHVVDNGNNYDGDYIWSSNNIKTRQELEEELDTIGYDIKQYHKYKNNPLFVTIMFKIK